MYRAVDSKADIGKEAVEKLKSLLVKSPNVVSAKVTSQQSGSLIKGQAIVAFKKKFLEEAEKGAKENPARLGGSRGPYSAALRNEVVKYVGLDVTETRGGSRFIVSMPGYRATEGGVVIKFALRLL